MYLEKGKKVALVLRHNRLTTDKEKQLTQIFPLFHLK
jgi:hypothetical protein